MFVGLSIYLYADLIDSLALTAFFISLLMTGFIVDSRKKIPSIKRTINDDKTSSKAIFYIGMIFAALLITKLFVFGAPLFANDSNFYRVEFARKYDIASYIARYICYLCIIILFLKSSYSRLCILVFIVCGIGLLSGYRSATALPIIIIFFINFLLWDKGTFKYIFRYTPYILIFVLILLTLMTWVTHSRFGGSGNVYSSAVILFERIYLHNYSNFLRVKVHFLDSPLYLESLWWDLRSIFSDKLGFSATMSMLSGSNKYDYIQMTPTFVGEGMANFGRHYYLHGFLIVYIVYFIRVALVSCKSNIGIACAMLVLVMVPISSGQGFGSFIFNLMPKSIIASVSLFLIYYVLPKKKY